MAIIRNLASMMLKGKIGDTTYYVAESRQLARQALNNSNYGATASRTDIQQTRRVRWANLVNFYSGNKAWMKKAYENLKPGVSIFNRFMQLNLPTADIALTKAQAQAKIWVVTPFKVTQGSLPSISPTVYGDGNQSTLELTITIAESTTVAQVSQNIIANNPSFADGDAIVCVTFAGTYTAPSVTNGYNPASYIYSEFVLNTSDERLMSAVYPKWVVVENYFAHQDADGATAFVYIHTRKSAGKLYVSTESILTLPADDSGLPEWKDARQLSAAIASYGDAANVPLAPGGSTSGSSGNDSSSGGGSNGDGSLE